MKVNQKMKVYFCLMLIGSQLIFSYYSLTAEEYNLINDSTNYPGTGNFSSNPNANYVSTTFTKYVYTYLFNNLANLNLKTELGTFRISQNYQGSYMKIQENPTRDDENWTFSYEKSVAENLNFLVNQNWQFTSDSRNIGINQLMRLNGMAGLSYIPQENYEFRFLYGLEDNNQLNFKSKGDAFSFSANANDIYFENFIMNSNFIGNLINLNDARKNRDLNGVIRISREVADESNFYFNLNYKNLQNNLLGYISPTGILPIEVRQENNITGNFKLDYSAAKFMKLNFDFRVMSLSVERNYKDNISEIPYSYFLRNIDQLEILGNVGLDLVYGNFKEKILFGFSSRSEKNNLMEKFTGGDLTKYQGIESQRDNSSGRVNIFSNTMYSFSPSTYLIGTFFIQLFRYDTPSQLNFDDRDELNNIINLRFVHKFSNYLNFQLEFENRQNHLVYIFSERSSMNNWNRVFRLSPQISFQIGNFSMNPKFEVLANYTIYDYTKLSSSMNSISFRQISYSDSLYLKITNKISVHSLLKTKYSERGILFWSDFSEAPQSGNYEMYGKLIFKRNYTENIWIGSGVNFYRYSQIRLNNNSQIDYNLESLSPEISINYVYNSWNLSILGWYEFQTIKSSIKNQITNLSINVNLLF